MTMMEMDDELKRELEHFNAVREDAKRDFGEWDQCDPVALAILEVVRAQTGLARAIDEDANYGVDARIIEEAIEARAKAISTLQKAIEQESR